MSSGAEDKYPCMVLSDIMSLDIPAQKNAVLFLWATVPLLPEAFSVMSAWGFQYKTMITWRKMSQGLGYWYRGQCEHLLVGVKGRVKAFRMQVPNFHQCKVGRHSEKPAYFRELIETSVVKTIAEPAKLEMFAREQHDGWDVFGNQVKNSIIIGRVGE